MHGKEGRGGKPSSKVRGKRNKGTAQLLLIVDPGRSSPVHVHEKPTAYPHDSVKLKCCVRVFARMKLEFVNSKVEVLQYVPQISLVLYLAPAFHNTDRRAG